MTELRLGFAGVGKMGGLMAARLIGAGHPLTVFDANDLAVESLSQGRRQARQNPARACRAGGDCIRQPADARRGAGSCARGRRHCGEHGVTKLFVDLSTTGPRVARMVAEGLAAKGITAVDCPVSGGLSGARNGTLALMVSCPAAAYDQLQELLAVFGKPIFVSEMPGAAQTMKLANNLLAACAIAISSEAFVFGVKGGLDPATMCEVFNASSGRNTATLDKFPRSVLPGTFDFGFSTALAFKDVKLCLDEAEALGVPTPVGNAVRQILGVTQAMFGPEFRFHQHGASVRTMGRRGGALSAQSLNEREAADLHRRRHPQVRCVVPLLLRRSVRQERRHSRHFQRARIGVAGIGDVQGHQFRKAFELPPLEQVKQLAVLIE